MMKTSYRTKHYYIYKSFLFRFEQWTDCSMLCLVIGYNIAIFKCYLLTLFSITYSNTFFGIIYYFGSVGKMGSKLLEIA